MKYVLPLLVASTQAAATESPITNTDFPMYKGGATTPSGAGIVDALNVLPAFQQDSTKAVNYGLYKAVRSGIFAFPTQTLSALADSTDQTVIAVASGTRAFWQTAYSQLGTMKGKIGTNADGAEAATYSICYDKDKVKVAADAYKTCNGGGGIKNKTAYAGNGIAYRLAINYAVAQSAIDIGGVTTLQSVVWNNDLVLASLYQAAQADNSSLKEDGTIWCSKFKNTVPKDTSKNVVLGAQNGLNGGSKCTFQAVAEEGTVGPGFTLTKADYLKFELQFVEWIKNDALGTDAIIPAAADTSKFLIGAYANTDGTWLNPIKTQISGSSNYGTWKANNLVINTYDKVDTYVPGSIGTAAFYPQQSGPYSDTQILTADSLFLVKSVDAQKSENSKYEGIKKDYNTKRTAYDDAVGKENERLKDIFKAAFDPKVEIPTRPVAPSPPPKFQGPYLALSGVTGSTAVAWQTTATKQGSKAYLQYTKSGSKVYDNDNTFANRSGYLVTSPDGTAFEYTGHLFGRLGQGKMTLPKNASPFYYGEAASANTPTIMLSLLPSVAADGGLTASGKQIQFTFQAKSWQNVGDYEAPGQPSKPANPVDPPAGAFYLQAAGIATAIALSLY